MKKNIQLFTGDESYFLNKEIDKRKQGFANKHGKENIFQFKSDEFDSDEIINTIFSGGLFSQKKLVFIYGVPKDSFGSNKITSKKISDFEEVFQNKFYEIDDDVFVVFVSLQPDKRTKFYKFLKNNISIKSFNKMKEKDVVNFIKDNYMDVFESEKEIIEFVEIVGVDMYMIENEIKKLKSYVKNNNKKIDSMLIREICFAGGHINSFLILDHLFSDKNKALNLLEKSQKDGADSMQILGMLAWSARVSIYIIDYYNNVSSSSKDIASSLSLHPFVVSKTLKHIQKLSKNYQSIKTFFHSIVILDKTIKNGNISQDLIWLNLKKIITKI
ncbi:DNA polymerase III subunit delta [Candidatus Absconditicoccus praedator]|uniref:DNA polymerase III subunit delta n=1 Tax=Candidatus Absconditicoccus praedator TaxID=2735562 RepID=UPI001E4C1F44|nr:DNA polymerase III subunit delta [Candidatus Absconditicoccus praedator]UFX82565.1 DNA polymerase III subunit delta [Candidatus Absconditicoccus praedator]